MAINVINLYLYFQFTVACELGRLYNKDAVIEFLLNRDSYPKDFASHIRGLKDIVELKLTHKTDYQGNSGKGGEYVDHSNSPFICPVVGIEMSGRYRFVYVHKCGCVFSERALKEVKSETCHLCGQPFDAVNDVIVLNGTSEDVEKLEKRMQERRAKAKSEKKQNKKRKAQESQEEDGQGASKKCSPIIKMKQTSAGTCSTVAASVK